MSVRENRRDEWLKKVDEWASRHGISRESALSIMTESRFNDNDPDNDLVILKDLYWNGWELLLADYYREKYSPH